MFVRQSTSTMTIGRSNPCGDWGNIRCVATFTAKAATTFVLWKRLVLRANADYNYYRGITDTFLEERLICNAMLGVKLFRNCLGEASVGVNDILDQNGTTFRRTVSGTTLRNVTNLAIGRYLSFQFSYNLRLFRRQRNAVMDALQGK